MGLFARTNTVSVPALVHPVYCSTRKSHGETREGALTVDEWCQETKVRGWLCSLELHNILQYMPSRHTPTFNSVSIIALQSHDNMLLTEIGVNIGVDTGVALWSSTADKRYPALHHYL